MKNSFASAKFEKKVSSKSALVGVLGLGYVGRAIKLVRL